MNVSFALHVVEKTVIFQAKPVCDQCIAQWYKSTAKYSENSVNHGTLPRQHWIYMMSLGIYSNNSALEQLSSRYLIRNIPLMSLFFTPEIIFIILLLCVKVLHYMCLFFKIHKCFLRIFHQLFNIKAFKICLSLYKTSNSGPVLKPVLKLLQFSSVKHMFFRLHNNVNILLRHLVIMYCTVHVYHTLKLFSIITATRQTVGIKDFRPNYPDSNLAKQKSFLLRFFIGKFMHISFAVPINLVYHKGFRSMWGIDIYKPTYTCNTLGSCAICTSSKLSEDLGALQNPRNYGQAGIGSSLEPTTVKQVCDQHITQWYKKHSKAFTASVNHGNLSRQYWIYMILHSPTANSKLHRIKIGRLVYTMLVHINKWQLCWYLRIFPSILFTILRTTTKSYISHIELRLNLHSINIIIYIWYRINNVVTSLFRNKCLKSGLLVIYSSSSTLIEQLPFKLCCNTPILFLEIAPPLDWEPSHTPLENSLIFYFSLAFLSGHLEQLGSPMFIDYSCNKANWCCPQGKAYKQRLIVSMWGSLVFTNAWARHWGVLTIICSLVNP